MNGAIWTTKDGRSIPIEDMHWYHLINTINMILRKLRDGTYKGEARESRICDLQRFYDEVHDRCTRRR
jgi:hypothetical protein